MTWIWLRYLPPLSARFSALEKGGLQQKKSTQLIELSLVHSSSVDQLEAGTYKNESIKARPSLLRKFAHRTKLCLEVSPVSAVTLHEIGELGTALWLLCDLERRASPPNDVMP